jgi:hypothetical protein
MKDQEKLNFNEVIDRIRTAVNIATGDDGSKSKEVLETFRQLCLMNKKQYEEQVKHFG